MTVIAVSLGASFSLLALFKYKLEQHHRAYRQSFAALKIALDCRHHAVRSILETVQNNQEHIQNTRAELLEACREAEAILIETQKTFSSQSLSHLCVAETKLNRLLVALSKDFSGKWAKEAGQTLKNRIEMLEVAEKELSQARRRYNRAAETYNHILRKAPSAVIARILGHRTKVGLVKFEEQTVASIHGRLAA